jgi:hypothetical protein
LKGLLRKRVVVHLLELKHVCPLERDISSSNPIMTIGNCVDQSKNSSDLADSDAPALQQLLMQYQHLFKEPTKLPPERSYDHHKPLIPGSQPVNVRPYRYAPHQKDEIERQVKKTLQSGIIRHSVSPFASPVLLVKKERWILEVLCGLQAVECYYSEKQAPTTYC